MYVCVYIYMYMYICMYVCMYVCILVCMCIPIYTYSMIFGGNRETVSRHLPPRHRRRRHPCLASGLRGVGLEGFRV